MQRIIQINIAGRIIPIEEDAYQILKNYIASLSKQFAKEEGKDEIIQDIENRIAELFQIRLQSGAPAIDKADVQKVMETLGAASELNEPAGAGFTKTTYLPAVYGQQQQQGNQQQYDYVPPRRLYRNPHDKIIGGVCSGVANYFDIDPVIARLVMVVLFLTAGIGLVAYILAWIIIPAAKTPADLGFMTSGRPMDFDTIQRNMADELQDLKRRGEEMSRELRDFFNKKK
jgi:phage shock protein C